QDRLGVQLGDGASYTNYLSPPATALTSNCWHHVAISVDRQSAATLYVDGSALATFDPSVYAGDLGNRAAPRIGASLDTSLQPFDGQIDELQIFGRALSQADVQSIVGAGGFGQCRCMAPPAGLVSWWSADGHASDIQGGNDGTPVGGVTYTTGPNEQV